MIRLGVNIDHVATVRQARGEKYPDPVAMALLAEQAGADNITCHLREDRRHIQDRDVERLKESLNVPLNFELAATKEMLYFAKKIRPSWVTIVPEKRQELTTEGGLDFAEKESLYAAICQLREQRISVSLFVEPTRRGVDESSNLGAQAIEFHTGNFVKELALRSLYKDKLELVLSLSEISTYAAMKGLQVHLGHGLNYQNANWIQLVSKVEEANIGHAIISRAISTGLLESVITMKNLLNEKRYRPSLNDNG